MLLDYNVFIIHLNLKMNLFLLLLFVKLSESATYTLDSCTSNQFFDSTTLTCIDCPTNMRPNPSQNIPTSCICKAGFYQTSLTTCSSLGPTTCGPNQYYQVYNNDGSFISVTPSNSTCADCDAAAIADTNQTGCKACPRNMVYNSSEKICACQAGFLSTQRGCFSNVENANTNSLGSSSSRYYQQLKYLFPICEYFKDLLSCSHLVNLCTYSMALDGHATQPQCLFFTTLNSYQYYLKTNQNSDRYYISPGKFSKNQDLKFKLLYYLPTGNFVKEDIMNLPDILRCGMPNDNSITIKLGSNVQVSCSFDFNYLIAKISTKTYQNYLYQLYMAGQGDAYFPVDVFIGTSTVAVKRFFLEDTYTSNNYVNVLTNLKLSIFLNETSYLTSPQLKISYTKLSYQNGIVSPATDKDKTLTYQIKFIYTLTSFWPPFLGIFIAINVLVLIQSIIRTYIAYLNRRSILSFFYFFPSFWSTWIFYFLIVISGYWFLFAKTTQNVYIFIPDSNEDIFYVAFYIIAGVMGLFRIITVLYDKFDKLNYEIFMINWEKGKNSWRQIFIINSFAQFYTHRTVSFFWMMLCLLFFLVGLSWQSHAAEVAHTTLSSVYYFNPTNRIFLYFMGATVFLVIGIIFKILRRISVIQWPYPFEDFVDYCNVANISFFFMKKRSPQAYYIHASIMERTEVTYKEINEAIRRGLNKERNLLREHSFHDSQRIYNVYLCKDLEEKFNNMIKKCEDEQHDKSIKHAQKNNLQEKKKSKIVHPRQQFVQKKLKPYLDDISRKGSNRTKSFFNRLIGKPEIDLREQNASKTRNQVFFDEYLDIVSEVFPNGNEFEEIHTIIIIFLMFLLLTANVCASVLLTYFVDYYMIGKWVQNSCRKNLQKMTKVKQGFML